MFPFPVRAINGTNIELNNEEKFNNLNPNIRNLIISSTLRFKIGHISLCRSQYLPGRIMSTADKIVSFGKEDFTLNGIKACLTGINPDLNNYKGHGR